MGLNVKDVKLGVVGCGKMASAILAGISANSFILPENICVYDINSDASLKLCSKFNFSEALSLKELFDNSDVVLLAVKPFIIRDILLEIKEFYKEQPILSILAGVKIKKYNSILPNAPIVRIMPNTPALVNCGMSVVCANEFVDEYWFEFSKRLMKNCGEILEIEEDKFDIVTALSGSGPAFYFRIIDLLAKSAQKLGLSKKDAILLSAQTALGSAQLLKNNEYNVDELIKNVTTPGGCTEVGNQVLFESNIDTIFDELIVKTADKSAQLG